MRGFNYIWTLVVTLIILGCKGEVVKEVTSKCHDVDSPKFKDEFFLPFTYLCNADDLKCDYLNKNAFSDGFDQLLNNITSKAPKGYGKVVGDQYILEFTDFKALTDSNYYYRARKIFDAVQRHSYYQNYQLHVVQSRVQNACAFPGHNILITTGMMDYASDDLLAFIFGHEIGHHENKHMEPEINLMYSLDNDVSTKDHLASIGLMGFYLISKRFQVLWDQSYELEADAAGMYLSSQAGYNPYSALGFFDDIARRESEYDGYMSRAQKSIFRTHPYSIDRRNCIQHHLDKAKVSIENYKENKDVLSGFPLKDIPIYKLPNEGSYKITDIDSKDTLCVFGTVDFEKVENDKHHKWAYVSLGHINGWVMDEYIKY